MAENDFKILLIDEDKKVHLAFQQLFAGKFNVQAFTDPEEALDWLKKNRNTPVIVSGFNLPGAGGLGFLKTSEKFAPMASRILLTGEKSVEVAKRAINEAGVFMFLLKPVAKSELISAISAAMSHHAKIAQERALLEKTLSGSVKLLIDMLALFHSEAFRRTTVMRQQASRLAKYLGISKTWELDMAIMFSPLGEALLPKHVLSRYHAARSLSAQEREVLAMAPGQTRDLLKNIPHLEKVADILYLGGRGYDGSGFPEDGPVGEDIPLNARVLKLLTDLWFASAEQGVDAAAFEALKINAKQYDPKLLELAENVLLTESGEPQPTEVISCYIKALRPGDELVDDILSEGSNELILSRGHQLTLTTIRRLSQYHQVAGVRQPVRVRRLVTLIEPTKEPLIA
ncbi:MAG: response regulator [Rhodobacteraceae bacterium]|nr:response regulator [Paracoccaceae bacterium]